jgi:Spy/CpxP family protein refolding chaperone
MAALAFAALGALAPLGAQGHGWHRGHDHGMSFERLGERLDLSAEQRRQLDALSDRQREALKPLHEAARQAHEAFREALEAESPDAAVVGQAALAMHAAHKNVRAAQKAAFDEMKALLTPEQLEKLEQSRERGFGDARGPRGDRPERQENR